MNEVWEPASAAADENPGFDTARYIHRFCPGPSEATLFWATELESATVAARAPLNDW